MKDLDKIYAVYDLDDAKGAAEDFCARIKIDYLLTDDEKDMIIKNMAALVKKLESGRIK